MTKPLLKLKWQGSRFNRLSEGEQGEIVLHNSYAGALARYIGPEAETVRALLKHGLDGAPTGVAAELAFNGFLVPEAADEIVMADDLHRQEHARRDAFELILMPNENCNFRCVYCYESFLHNKMLRPVIDGVLRFAENRIADLDELTVGWFGGEPLTAPEIIEEISTHLRSLCAAHDVAYFSSMVTNGYLLDEKMADMLMRAEVRQFQITLDGPKEHHDRLRLLGNRRDGTFDRIFENLMALTRRDDQFDVVVRVNFDQNSSADIEPFVAELNVALADDARFYLDFHPVGQWGGPNDERLMPCDASNGRESRALFFDRARREGFDLRNLRQRLRPNGAACYAANPNSVVIGSNGTVYKCTVAFEDERNHVGRIDETGDLNLDEERLALWVSDPENLDAGCTSCHFRPSCRGDACPWARIRTGQTHCPSDQINIDKILQVLAQEAVAEG
ncbi:MAG: radical SAM protein [Paracoccaceae bacterium]